MKDNLAKLNRFQRWLHRKRIADGQFPQLLRFGHGRWRVIGWFAEGEPEDGYRTWERVG